MKQIIFLIILIPAILSAQTATKTVVSDSSWLTNTSGVFYRAQLIQYSTGEKVLTESPIGDTSTTYTKFRADLEAISNRFASDIEKVASYKQQVAELIRFGKELPALIGRSPYDSLRNGTDLLNSGWKVDGVAISFRVNNAGNFQWKYDTLADWSQAAYLGGIIRLNGFNGYTTDFYKRSNNRWITADNRYAIRKPGDTAARSRDIDIDDTPAPAAHPKTEFLPNGTVRVGEVVYKYNSKKKTWLPL